VFEVRCFESFQSAAALREPVNALNGLGGSPDPFSSFEFLETYERHDELRAQRQGLPLWLLAVFQAERLVGFVALAASQRRVLGLRRFALGYLVTRDTDRPRVLAEPGAMPAVTRALLDYIAGRWREWQLLELYQQDAASPWPDALSHLPAHRYAVASWPCLPNATIGLRWGSLQAYADALVRKFRVNVVRQMRNLAASGAVQVLASDDPQVTPALLAICRNIELRSWKRHAQATIGRHADRQRYFEALLAAHQPMQIAISILLRDGLPIAGMVLGRCGNRLAALHIVYDEDCHQFAPGSALLLLAVRRGIEAGCSELNLLSGFGYYKTRWLAQMTETRILQVYRRGTLLYWKRRAGELWRSLRPAAAAGDPAQFNGTRRNLAVAAVEGAPAARPATRSVDPAVDALLATVRAGRHESLSGEQFASIMALGGRAS
jgi:hypothetical protein